MIHNVFVLVLSQTPLLFPSFFFHFFPEGKKALPD